MTKQVERFWNRPQEFACFYFSYLKGCLVGHSLFSGQFVATVRLIGTQGNALGLAIIFASNVSTASSNATSHIDD
jgi:hypothetical protein